MKEYEKLARIKYDNRLFDIFVDDKHRKYFLEVRLIEGKEVYYYLNYKDYLYLDKIYNSKDSILYSNKIKMAYKVLISTALALTLTSTLNISSKNIKLQHENKYVGNKKIENNQLVGSIEQKQYKSVNDVDVSEYDKYIYANIGTEEHEEDFYCTTLLHISNINELDSWGIKKVDFNDLRKSLEENNRIPEEYRGYVKEYIDLLEERMPNIDLRIFNENLKKMEFETIDLDNWDIEYADGYINTLDDKTVITLKSEYQSEARKKEVIVHELSHALRCGEIKVIKKEEERIYVLDNDFRDFGYHGNHFNECLNTIIEQYLLSDDYENYFNADYYFYNAYKETEYVYQLLKLMNTYDLNDFLNNDVFYLENYLAELGFDKLIDLYDVQLKSEREKNIVLTDNELIDSYKEQIIEMRVEQLRNNDYSEQDIYKFVSKFPKVSSMLENFSLEDKYGSNWEYAFGGQGDFICSNVEKVDENGNKVITQEEVFNRYITIYSNGSKVYEFSPYDSNGNINPQLYLLALDENGLISYKFVLLGEDNMGLDIISNKPFTYDNSNTIIKPIDELFSSPNLNVLVNYDNFIKSDICNNIGLELQNKISDEISRSR